MYPENYRCTQCDSVFDFYPYKCIKCKCATFELTTKTVNAHTRATLYNTAVDQTVEDGNAIATLVLLNKQLKDAIESDREVSLGRMSKIRTLARENRELQDQVLSLRTSLSQAYLDLAELQNKPKS